MPGVRRRWKSPRNSVGRISLIAPAQSVTFAVAGAKTGTSSRAETLHIKGKGSKDRVICRATDPLFVTAAGDRITGKVVTRAALKVAGRFGRHLHPHMFRHSYATELLDRGADLRDIKELLGHESIATTEIYALVSAARQRRTVQLLERPGAIRSAFVPGGEQHRKRCLGSEQELRKRAREGL